MAGEKTPFELSDEDNKSLSEMEEADKGEQDEDPGEDVGAPEPDTPDEDPEEDGNEATPAPKRGRSETVPHQKYHQERERRKAVEAEAARLREERARFDERLKVLQELQNPQPQEEDRGIDPDGDPMGAIKYTYAEIEAWKREKQEAAAREREQSEQTKWWEDVYSEAMREWEDFVEDAPEAKEAYDYLVQSMGNEFIALGYSQDEATSLLQQEEARAIVDARQRNVPLGKVVLGKAKARGWKPETDPAVRQVRKVAEAQTRGRSLSQTGGSSGVSEMTVERLLAMTPAEFEVYASKNPKRTAKLMGA